jgi:endoglucanase
MTRSPSPSERRPDRTAGTPRRARHRLAVAALAGAAALALQALVPASPAGAATAPGLRNATLHRVSDPAANRVLAGLRLAGSPSAGLLSKSINQPQAVWVGGWVRDVRGTVGRIAADAATHRTVPVFVVYHIPFRDCATWSVGARTPAAYRSFVDAVARGIGNRRAAVILEPDALAHITCLGSSGQQTRLDLLRWAVVRLSRQPGTAVYLDAGHRYWQSPSTMATRLKAAGIGSARGFALNVANFDGTASEVAYGKQISARVGGKPFVVDTGRNGAGPAPSGVSTPWCNPPGRALGPKPTTRYPDPAVDALLWVKRVGESDGSCRPGAPSAGHFYLGYLLGMVSRAAW